MDVFLSVRRVYFVIPILLFIFGLAACGNRFDLSKERGRQARIDEANFFLSQENCGAALEAINPLYGSIYVDDEVRIITASAYACSGKFRLLSMAAGIAGASNFFSGMVKGLSDGGGATNFYSATDVMTGSGARLAASQRSTRENNFMVFLQMGVISSILKTYGAPDASGNQTTHLVYTTAANPAGEMTDVDACALTGAIGILYDSYKGSSLNDSDTVSLTNNLNAICVAAGLSSCSVLNKDRSLCDGVNANSVVAESVVGGVNAAW
ncbi:MAG: hypothetical protein ACXWQO_09070 [Bdellovibrionota bacterium]